MTVNEALIVCEILKNHGYGDYDMRCEDGYNGLRCFPDYDYDYGSGKYINMEGGKNKDGTWSSGRSFHEICDEIENALKKAECRQSEYKPCPFCGSEPTVSYVNLDNGATTIHIECDNPKCGVVAFTRLNFLSDDKVVEAWNRRVGNDRTD